MKTIKTDGTVKSVDESALIAAFLRAAANSEFTPGASAFNAAFDAEIAELTKK